MAVCTVLNLGECDERLGRIVARLVATQGEDGSWPRSAFYTDSFGYYGSEELTTGLCAEAMARNTDEAGR